MKLDELSEGQDDFEQALEKLAKKHRIPSDGVEMEGDEIKMMLDGQAEESDMDAFEKETKKLAKKYQIKILNFEWDSDDLTIFIDD